MSGSVSQEQVAARLRERLSPVRVEVHDESHLHAGHGASGAHFRVLIVAPAFAGLSRVAAQRLVYAALSDWMGGAIHACAITAQAPDG